MGYSLLLFLQGYHVFHHGNSFVEITDVERTVVNNLIKPSQLFIPLDVHVGDTARALGLVSRRANDRRTVEELTGVLRQMRPADPVVYDFALFGIGIGDKYLGPSVVDN